MQRKQPVQRPMCMRACGCTCVSRHVHCVHAHTCVWSLTVLSCCTNLQPHTPGLVGLPAHTQARDHSQSCPHRPERRGVSAP